MVITETTGQGECGAWQWKGFTV